MKLLCPICRKSSEFEDVGVGWKCPNCTGRVFSEYIDKNGKKHYYSDNDIQRSNLATQTHIFDLDATDIMTGNTEPGPFYSETFASTEDYYDPSNLENHQEIMKNWNSKRIASRLAKLADKLDEKGYSKEADVIDEELGSEDFIDPKQLPDHFIHSLSGESMANL